MKGRINRPTPGIDRVVLPRVGFIKVGIKEVSKTGKEYPKSVDYFVATGKYAELFRQAYGDRPQTIQIMFVDDDPAKSCNEMYVYWDNKGRKIAYGDGETFFVWNGERYEQFSIAEHPNLMQGVEKKYPNGKGWQITLTLTFIVPLVRGIAGVWQFVTKGSASTIPNVRDAFDAMLQDRGFVKGIIWDMNVQFAVSQKPGDNSRYPVVTIVPNESEGNLRKIHDAFKPIKLLDDGKNLQE